MTFRAKENRILTCLRRGEIPLGTQFNTADPSLVEILAYTGFDFYMLCLEHARIGPERMENCIRAADAAGITTIVRVPENEPTSIRYAIESGAQGIVVPHIANADDARRAIANVRYPPEGTCGICPAMRAANYSIEGWNDYLEHSRKETMIILLLESMEAVENAEEIFSLLNPEVDAAGMGRGDLSQSIARPGEKVSWDDPALEEAFARVLAASGKYGIPLMDMPRPEYTPECARRTIESGVRILLYGVEQFLFYNLCKDIVQKVKAI